MDFLKNLVSPQPNSDLLDKGQVAGEVHKLAEKISVFQQELAAAPQPPSQTINKSKVEAALKAWKESIDGMINRVLSKTEKTAVPTPAGDESKSQDAKPAYQTGQQFGYGGGGRRRSAKHRRPRKGTRRRRRKKGTKRRR